jgi:hypothetical protein
MDEKHVDGRDLWGGKARRDPTTGIVEDCVVPGDFRVRHNIFALIGISGKSPVAFTVSEENGDSLFFITFIMRVVKSGFFALDCVLVLDNAPIHTAKLCEELTNFCYNYISPNPDHGGKPLHLILQFLPSRFPERTPTELVFNTLIQRMRSQVSDFKSLTNGMVAALAAKVLSEFTYEDIAAFFVHQGYKKSN